MPLIILAHSHKFLSIFAFLLVFALAVRWQPKIDSVFGLNWQTSFQDQDLEPEKTPVSSRLPISEQKKEITGKYLTRRVSELKDANHVHAASAVQLEDNSLIAFWYGGSREGAKDVKIYQAKLQPGANQWSEAKALMDAKTLSFQLSRYIKKLGNPLVIRKTDGKLWLSFVSVSVGGWAGSSLNWMESIDQGNTWSRPKRWVTSPFFNVSTLVKNPVQHYANGWIGIPIYHEFIGKFGEYLILDQEGRIQTKQRMTWGRDALQPLVLPYNKREASSYLRFAGGHPNLLLATASHHGGLKWKTPGAISLPNPNSSVAGIALSSNEQLLVFNNSPIDRKVLSLGYSPDRGRHWHTLFDFERDKGSSLPGFSYPVLFRGENNRFHLFYTWNREYIKHIEFDLTWLNEKIQNTVTLNGSLLSSKLSKSRPSHEP